MTQSFKLTAKQSEQRNIAAGPAKHVLAYGGSRSGKTFGFVYFIVMRALMAPGSRHGIFRRHGVAVKQSIGQDTLQEVIRLAFPGLMLHYRDKDGVYILPNGSEIWLAGLDDKERVDKVLGREFATIYLNESSEIPYQSYVVLQTRLAQLVKKSNGETLALKFYVDLNPTTTKHWTYRLWIDGINPDGEQPIDRDQYALIVMNPRDNTENLPTDYLLSLSQMSERQKQRFYFGNYSADTEHALWRREYIHRVQMDALPDMRRVVVAVDPAISNEIGSDETGIVCAALGMDGRGYVLADSSGKMRPEEWSARVASLFVAFSADRIIAEVNQGGDMVESVLRAQGKNLPVKKIHATRGKVMRAEPVASLYERGKVFHAGEFDDLESQMCSFSSDFDRKLQGYSPDRVDALVWAFTELMPVIANNGKRGHIVRKPIERFI